ncbi:helix-turn-helix domain-containing protein [Bacillus paramycoides]|uniref:helix-turn-helix domain-containing protein n=1 Tax=Bacillus paramycoides TaxID=2026194 RepID=UPI002E1C174C|nr:helix-turn-helix domain-containing protein [Bacillus paramycoides]
MYNFENEEQVKVFAADNVLTTQEVAEILNVSRARVSALVNEEKLVPIKRTQKGTLFFWKSDVLERKKIADSIKKEMVDKFSK